VLEAHLEASDRFKGIRYATADASGNPRDHTHPPPGLLLDPTFRAGFECLAALGLSFDGMAVYTQFADLACLARIPGRHHRPRSWAGRSASAVRRQAHRSVYGVARAW
jgi:hypothetical protein